MFSELAQINSRPAPFSASTAELLWADPHVSEQMLRFHLDGSVNVSSRTTDVIGRSVDWLTGTVGIAEGTRVLDLGCGPGSYGNRLSAVGAAVTGIDFSDRSIRHAQETAQPGPTRATYIQGNYLDVPIPGTFDVALMIMCDFCAISPEQRSRLLGRLRTLLEPGGRFVFDVYGLPALAARQEVATYSASLLGGFWSPQPHFEFLNTFVYQAERVTLDKCELVEAHRSRTVYNWLQHFDAHTLEDELERNDFELTTLVGDLTGAPFDADAAEFAVVATVRSPRQ
jgi:SAM-dependent methyltransferase